MLAATMKSFLESSYSLPFKLFHWQAPNHCADPIIAMVTVNLLIYLALNPPLPPRVITRPANSYRWADIYPPHRFVVALGVLNDVAPLTDPDSIDNMARYISDVADAAGLAYAGNDVLPPRTPIEPDWDQYSEQSDYPIAIDDELVIQAQLRLERISNRLPLLANYASCLAGPLAPTFAPILVASSKRFDFMGPPLEFASDAEIGFRGTREFGNNVLRSVATSHSLFELAVGSGELAITEFPLRPQEDQGLLSFMDRTLRHMIIDTENT
jgi:hypothetical protein